MARRTAPQVVVVCGKGGDTKSTTAGAVASGAARAGKRVLVVDLDAQGTLSRWLAPESTEGTVADVLLGAPLDQVVAAHWLQPGWPNHATGLLDVLAAGAELANLETGDQREAMRALVLAAAGSYDLVVIDTAAWRPAGPSASLQMAALWHATRALIPLEPAAASVFNLREVTETISAVGKHRRRALPVSLLPTRMGAREADAAATVSVLAQIHHVLPAVRRSAYARRAMLAHQSLEDYAMTNTRAVPLVQDYAGATAALLGALDGAR